MMHAERAVHTLVEIYALRYALREGPFRWLA